MNRYEVSDLMATMTHPSWGKKNYFCIEQERKLTALIPEGRDRKIGWKHAEHLCFLLNQKPIKIKFANEDCCSRPGFASGGACSLYETELEFSNAGDITSALESGWPICPDCEEYLKEV